MDIRFNILGIIKNGVNPEEKFIKIIDDKENTGGFLILLSETGNFDFPYGYDEWAENLETLQKYLLESNWIIEWKEFNID